MADYGLRKPYVAKYDKENDAYSDGFVYGKAVSVEVTPNYVEGSLYADDEQAEYEKAFQNDTVTLGTDRTPKEAMSVVFGHVVSEDGEVVKKATDDPNNVGIGFIVTKVENGTRSYEAHINPCVKFSEPANSYATKGDSITFNTPTIEGVGIPDAKGNHEYLKTFTTDTEAAAYIMGKLNIKAASAETGEATG